MSFRDRPFDERFTKMGDQAESVFEEVYGRGFVRFGLNRPPIRLADVPARIRYTPDYLSGCELVEVQGVGADQTIKIKRDKLDCLCWWNTVFPVTFFVWDSKNKRYAYLELDALCALIDGGKVTLGHFPEGKAYYALPCEHVVGWADHDT